MNLIQYFIVNILFFYILNTFNQISSRNYIISGCGIPFYEEDLLMVNVVKWGGMANPDDILRHENKSYSQELERDWQVNMTEKPAL